MWKLCIISIGARDAIGKIENSKNCKNFERIYIYIYIYNISIQKKKGFAIQILVKIWEIQNCENCENFENYIFNGMVSWKSQYKFYCFLQINCKNGVNIQMWCLSDPFQILIKIFKMMKIVKILCIYSGWCWDPSEYCENCKNCENSLCVSCIHIPVKFFKMFKNVKIVKIVHISWLAPWK